MTAPAANSERIGEILVREGLITREQLNLALQEQRDSGARIGYNLVALGFVKEVDLTRTLARQYRMPAVDLTNFEIDPRIARLIPGEMAAKHLVLPLKRDGRTLTVAMADPTSTGQGAQLPQPGGGHLRCAADLHISRKELGWL